MVPLPEERKFPYDKEADRKSTLAIVISHAFSDNPDGGGVLLPPLKEEFKKNEKWWRENVHYPWHGAAVEYETVGLEYHPLATIYRLIGTMKYKLKPALADVVQYAILPFEKDYEEEGKKWKESHFTEIREYLKRDTFTRLKSLDEFLKDENKMKAFQREIEYDLKDSGVPEEHAKMLADLAPIFVKASKAWAEITKRAWKDMQKRGEKISPYKAAEKMFIHDPDPLGYVDLYAKPEEIEAIHQAHVAVYHLLPRMFKEKSGVKDLLDEERAKGLEEDVLKTIRRR